MSNSRKGSAPTKSDRSFFAKKSPYYYGGGHVEPRQTEIKVKDSGVANAHSPDMPTLNLPFSVKAPILRNPFKSTDVCSRSDEDVSGSWSTLFDKSDSETEAPPLVDGRRKVQKIVSTTDQKSFTKSSMMQPQEEKPSILICPIEEGKEEEEIEEGVDPIRDVFETPSLTSKQHNDLTQSLIQAFDRGVKDFVSEFLPNDVTENGDATKSGEEHASDIFNMTTKKSDDKEVKEIYPFRTISLKPMKQPFENNGMPILSSKDAESRGEFFSSKSYHPISNSLISKSKSAGLRFESSDSNSAGSSGGKVIERTSSSLVLGSGGMNMFPSIDNLHAEDTELLAHSLMPNGKILHEILPKGNAKLVDNSEHMDTLREQNEQSFAENMDHMDATAWQSQFDNNEPMGTRIYEATEFKISEDNMAAENNESKQDKMSIKVKENEKMFLSGVASAFYNGGWLPLDGVLSCLSMLKINEFLKERRNDLDAGVPGKWLTIVLGGESSDLSTIVSTIMYAYFLTLTTKPELLCIVPLVNMQRADLALHPEVSWLFKSCGLDIASLVFLDEISLSYYHRFGSLRLVLVNHSRLAPGQEDLRDDVEEIIDIQDQAENKYPHVRTVISDEGVGSSSTIIAESFAKHHPEILCGRAVSRLMLASILLDTSNLTTERSTRRDVCMVTLLLNGAGRFGRNGLFKILRKKSHDLTAMSTNQILRKSYKQLMFTKGADEGWRGSSEGLVGMSSVPIPLQEVLKWEPHSVATILDFQRSTNLKLYVIVTGYYETPTTFKREVLIVAESDHILNNISNFIIMNDTGVKFTIMHHPDLPVEMKTYIVEGKRVSRIAIQNIIEDFFST